jgi:hypothetical protein
VACLIILSLVACAALQASIEKGAPIADGACTALTATTDDGTVHQVCAVESVLSSIVDIIRAARAEAGPGRHLRQCAIVPRTTMCAAQDELAHAIDVVNAREGGAP